MLAESAQSAGDALIRGHEHAAFTRGEELSRVEGEGGQVRAGADWPAVVLRADRSRGVLDDGDPEWLSQCAHRVEVGRDARLVNKDDSARVTG